MPKVTVTQRDRALAIIHDLPADTSYDDILRELALHRMIERGLSDSKAGRTISHTELRRLVKSWRK